MNNENNHGDTMQLDGDALTYLWGLVAVPAVWVVKALYHNKQSLQELREEIAKDYYTKTEVNLEIKECSQEKDKILDTNKEDLRYIRAKVDKLVDRMMDK